MKNLQSIEEGTWNEVFFVALTAAEEFLLDSNDEMDIDAKKDLLARISTDKLKPASAEDAKLAQDFYATIKPKLKEGDEYKFLAMSMFIDGDNKMGILNCRVNEDHKQIRF
jgi:hypothetical protein